MGNGAGSFRKLLYDLAVNIKGPCVSRFYQTAKSPNGLSQLQMVATATAPHANLRPAPGQQQWNYIACSIAPKNIMGKIYSSMCTSQGKLTPICTYPKHLLRWETLFASQKKTIKLPDVWLPGFPKRDSIVGATTKCVTTKTIFHYTGSLIGILIMVHYNPYITG